MTVGFTNGCFDVLHVGHVEMLKFCKLHCAVLVVGIDTDRRVAEMKGDDRPVNSAEDRVKMLLSIRYVDEVVIFDTAKELESIVEKINPEIMVVGREYENKHVIGSAWAKKLLFFERLDEYSTTKTLQHLGYR